MIVYRISCGDGKFDHIIGKRAAIERAAEMLKLVKAERPNFRALSDQDRRFHWGVTIAEVTASEARAVGLYDPSLPEPPLADRGHRS